MAKLKSESIIEENVTSREEIKLPLCCLRRLLIQASYWKAHFRRFSWEIMFAILILMAGVFFFYLGFTHFDYRNIYHSFSIFSLPCAFIWTWLMTHSGPPILSGHFGTPKSPKYLDRPKRSRYLPPYRMTKEEIATAMQENVRKNPENVKYFEKKMVRLPLI